MVSRTASDKEAVYRNMGREGDVRVSVRAGACLLREDSVGSGTAYRERVRGEGEVEEGEESVQGTVEEKKRVLSGEGKNGGETIKLESTEDEGVDGGEGEVFDAAMGGELGIGEPKSRCCAGSFGD
jgi:hypothetical protein